MAILKDRNGNPMYFSRGHVLFARVVKVYESESADVEFHLAYGGSVEVQFDTLEEAQHAVLMSSSRYKPEEE